MSKIEREPIMDCLFSRQDMKLINIKFFRGKADVIAPEDLRAESHSAIMQARVDPRVKTTAAPRSNLPPIDVRKFVAAL